LEKCIGWSKLSLSRLDPRTKECELEVSKDNSFSKLVNQLPYVLLTKKMVTNTSC